MTDQAVKISRKEFSSAEVIEWVEEGQRVVVTIDVLGVERDVTLRKTDDEYVCDTGLKLMNYDDQAGLKTCIERLQLTDSE